MLQNNKLNTPLSKYLVLSALCQGTRLSSCRAHQSMLICSRTLCLLDLLHLYILFCGDSAAYSLYI
jgi:hypothetical protein